MLTKFCGIALMLVFVLGNKCCCEWKNRGFVPGRLEAYVVVGIGELPKDECIPAKEKLDMLVERPMNADMKVWLRAVFFDELNRPIDGRVIDLEIVDVTGATSPETQQISVTPNVVRTNARGFNESEIIVNSRTFGIFRMKASYADKNGRASSYSAPIYFRQ